MISFLILEQFSYYFVIGYVAGLSCDCGFADIAAVVSHSFKSTKDIAVYRFSDRSLANLGFHPVKMVMSEFVFHIIQFILHLLKQTVCACISGRKDFSREIEHIHQFFKHPLDLISGIIGQFLFLFIDHAEEFSDIDGQVTYTFKVLYDIKMEPDIGSILQSQIRFQRQSYQIIGYLLVKIVYHSFIVIDAFLIFRSAVVFGKLLCRPYR